MLKIFASMLKHKFIAVLVVAALAVGGYFGYQAISGDKEAVLYALAAVERGTIIVSVSGSGQVSASDQADIKSEIKSEVLAVYVEKGEEIKTGKLIAVLDDDDYQKAVSNAEISLETAQADLEELLSPVDELELFQAENALVKAYDSKIKAEEGIDNGLKDAFSSVTNIFFDLPTIVTTAENVLYGNDIAKSSAMISDYDSNETVYINSFSPIDRPNSEIFIRTSENDYRAARIKYDQNLKDYKNTDYDADSQAIEDLLNETAETVKATAQVLKSEINLLDFVVDYLVSHNRPVYSGITAYRATLQSYYSKTNSYLQTLYSVQNSLKSDRQTLVDAELSVKEKKLSLDNLQESPDELAIKTKKLAVQQKEDALAAAKQDLANCYVAAPFGGVVTEVNVKKGDSVSAGTAVASIITQQKIAEITFNEIDAANIKVGQKATLTFDALPEVSISGKVIDVDAIGTVAQGVVSYGVKIAFDTDVEQVKPGMSITADIIIEAKQDVLVLPNSAIKSQGTSYYVELAEVPEETREQLLASVSGVALPVLPKSQSIETGLASDFFTEIVDGLQEGDVVVSSTINSEASQTTQTKAVQTQGFQMLNAGGDVQMRNFSR